MEGHNLFPSDGIPEMTERNDVLRQDIAALTQEVDNLRKRDKVSQDIIKLVSSQNVQPKNTVELLEQEKTKIELENIELEGRIVEIKSDLARLESERGEQLELKTQLNKEFQSEKQKLQNRIKDLEKQYNEEKTKCSKTGNDLYELRMKFEAKCKENIELESKVEDLRAEQDFFQQEMDRAKSLEKELNEQKRFVMSKEEKTTIELAHKKVIEGMEEELKNMKRAHKNVIEIMEEEVKSMKIAHKTVIKAMGEANKLEILDQQKKASVLLEVRALESALEG